MVLNAFLWLLIGYLLGAIPFGFILTWLTGGGDIRRIGSGNIGATNVLRSGRKGLAAATLLLDAGKGALAVWLAGRFGEHPAIYLAAIGAFAGHVHPVWLKFRGGKGVATLFGIALAFSPWGAIDFAICWFAIAVSTRYSSLAGMTAGFAAALGLWLAHMTLAAETVVLLALWTLWTHRDNIARLRAGTEPKIGDRKTSEHGAGKNQP